MTQLDHGGISHRISFKELANRITGISTPMFGISWNPPELEVVTARRLITYLEDRRVLYVSYDDERLDYAVQSVIQIRARLTNDLEEVDLTSELAKSIRDMRTACRKFLNETQEIGEDRVILLLHHATPNYQTARFFAALGELRAVIGIHIAQIAVKYGIDVEESLSAILPTAPSED